MRGAFDYVSVRSVGEVCRLLVKNPEASILAGGTDLLVEIRNGMRSPDMLVDIKRIDELRRIRIDEDEIVVGASVPLNVLAEHRVVRESLPALADTALSIGTYQIRNRATLAGNLCNASPAADAAPVLMTLGAKLTVVGPEGERTLPVVALFTGVKRTSLTRGEVVTQVKIPMPENGTRTAFLKQQRIRGHDLALVNVAGSYDASSGTLRVAVGSCAPTPVLLEPIGAVRARHESIAERVVALAQAATAPISDVRASAAYRRAVLPVLLRRLIERLFEKGEQP